MTFLARTNPHPARFAILLFVVGFVAASCSSQHDRIIFQEVSTSFGFNNKLAEPFGIAINGEYIYVSDGNSGRIVRFSTEKGLEEFAGGLDTPSHIAFTVEEDLLIADSGSHTIKRIGADGNIETLAGTDSVGGFADGPAATARFNAPVGIVVSNDGRVFVADTYNDRIRLIENGIVRTIAGGEKGFADGIGGSAMFDTPLGIAAWHDDKLLVADSGNRRLRVVEPDGRVWTLAGDGSAALRDGSPGSSSFTSPTAVAVDIDGAIYIADGNAIRAIGRRSLPFVETISGGRRGFRNGVPAAGRFNRPSGIAVGPLGDIYVADSDNGLVRNIGGIKEDFPGAHSAPEGPPRFTPEEFRSLQPGRWPYDPPERTREIAGTLGEIRGEIVDQHSEAWFHNGLDIPGGYGETARFIRNEKVLDPVAVENFGTSRELIRMPTIGYVHIRLGRDSGGKTFGDPRFQFFFENGKPTGVRVPRGTRFLAGEPIGTLNSMNHVHLIAGRPGAEMNALDALVLPGISDGISPVIGNVRFYDESWAEIETKDATSRIKLNGKTRVVVRAYDRKDGNAERRRLAPYKIGYEVAAKGSPPSTPESWNISLEKMPPHLAVKYVYAVGSKSGATGETIFNFIATNHLDGEHFREGFLDPAAIEAGEHTLRVFVKDFFGNIEYRDFQIEVIK